MKLLSICIPTYNRPDRLRKLYGYFLQHALEEYGDQIEVIVRDNSDDENARLNQAIIGNSGRYYKNETNVSFWGSQIRLVRDATGHFIWIISDDDLILWEGFKRLMSCLPMADNEGVDCLMLPINYRNNMGELTESKNDGSKKCDVDLETYVTTLPVVPFGYFASAVIRLNKNGLDRVEKEFHGNEIINIPLFLNMLKPESKLRFLGIPVLEYQEVYYIKGEIKKFYNSHLEVTSFLEKEYRVDGAMLRDHLYKEVLLMVIVHRVGLRLYYNANKSRWFLLSKLRHNLNLKSLILSFLVLLPESLARPSYLSYLSINHSRACGGFSMKEAISRYRILHHFIRTKENERRSMN